MASFEERIYDLARDTLAEQERQVNEIRSRGATLLAAAALVGSVFARAVFDGDSPHGLSAVVATALGLLGAAGVLVSTALLLRPFRIGSTLRAGETYDAMLLRGLRDQPEVDLALVSLLEDRATSNDPAVSRLETCLGSALLSLVLETVGLATAAALAS